MTRAVARPGLTLLETLVALVILGLVVLAGLELFAGSSRLATDAERWGAVVAYAEEGIERVKIEGWRTTDGVVEAREDGLERRIRVDPAGDGLRHARVTVTTPGGTRFTLDRLVADP